MVTSPPRPAPPSRTAAGIRLQAINPAAEGTSGDVLTDLGTAFLIAGGPLITNTGIFKGMDLTLFTTSPVLADPRLGLLRGSATELVGADPADLSVKAAVDCSIALDKTGLVVDHCKANVNYAEGLVSDVGSASFSGKLARATDAMNWGFKLSVGLDTVNDTYSLGGNLYGEAKGQLAIDTTANTLAGFSRLSYSVDLKQADTADTTQDGTYTGSVSDQADIALTFDPTDKCVNGGTITLKRVWTTLPVGTGIWDMTATTFADESAQITYDAPVLPETCSTTAQYAVGTVTP